MEGLPRGRTGPLVAACALAAALLLQAPASAAGQAGSGSEALGRAGWAYMTGIRRFAAAVLWNRLEPIYHDYYESDPLSEQTHLLPTTWMVVRLDPQFEEPYYVTAWLLYRRGTIEEGLRLAEEGVSNNPRSGTMRANLAQLLMLEGRVEEALLHSDEAVEKGTWRDSEWRYEGFAVLRDVYRKAGREDRAASLQAALDHMAEEEPEVADPMKHDHDGDGVPDH